MQNWNWIEHPEYSVHPVDSNIIEVTYDEEGEDSFTRFFHRLHLPLGNYMADAVYTFFTNQGESPLYSK